MRRRNSLLAAAAILLPLQLERSRPGLRHSDELSDLRVLEALMSAGYRPTVWHNVMPPDFLRLRSGGRVLEVFDPFHFYGPWLSQR